MAEHTPYPPAPVRLPVMQMRWTSLAFLHWRYEPATVQRLLPAGLTVEPYDGAAWVGLVPFRMEVRVPGSPTLPWLSHFGEFNVRTYAAGPEGQKGIWFLSLEADRLAAVLTARATWQLPYFWARIRVDRADDRVEYESTRTWPGPRGVHSRVVVQAGEPFAESELSELDHYLTARFRLWSRSYGRLFVTQAQHPRWPLRRARLLDLSDELVVAAGLPPPVGEPVLHFSDGLPVKVGTPRPAGGVTAVVRRPFR